jgi:hypothetical protein
MFFLVLDSLCPAPHITATIGKACPEAPVAESSVALPPHGVLEHRS